MVFTVKSPIPGFAHITTMELVKIDDFFMRLESKDDATSFTLLNPYMLREYAFEIPPYYKSLLEITDESKIMVFNIMIIANPIENSSVNFIAPLVFNAESMTMAQILLDSDKHPDLGISQSIGSFLQEEEA
ncbi:flagellar assembly protein FliW [Sulfurospirillum sp. T05]|uniref:Flagellar assembly factor FliW n=1 Tax=Sulfurospirillum tamanense TaxID=2813362 RepID=A0ABS2WQC8_9BACT|nr:flagellar assembly protein FliW [Sulfurospirillum tamanensis]MBN2963808.1 flagellar assembly protein FliW [Sulfurospirillum tamanensis]